MEKEQKTSEKDGLEYLNQLIKTLDESIHKLEIYYENKDYENFDKMKKFTFKIFIKISELIK